MTKKMSKFNIPLIYECFKLFNDLKNNENTSMMTLSRTIVPPGAISRWYEIVNPNQTKISDRITEIPIVDL